MDMTSYRTEHDVVGTQLVPANAYYGAQTMRAVENFAITGQRLRREMIHSLAIIKKAAALTNRVAGTVPPRIADAIVAACDELLQDKFHDQFLVDPIQGGAGTSTNMNANEVIANRAAELLGGKRGDYDLVHPNDHVNCGQSTNDVYPSCGKMTTVVLLGRLDEALNALLQALEEKAISTDVVVKMGRTQLQDAVPIRLGQEFGAYAAAIRRDIDRLRRAGDEMHVLNLGGTAIGTGINASSAYIRDIVASVSKLANEPYRQAKDLVDGTQNLDYCTVISGALKTCVVNLSKMCNDLRLMSSGPCTGFGEIMLPARQNGSSIMPGKVNPVIPEVVNQIAFSVIGNDATITLAAEAGQMELNAFEPIIFYKLFESISTLTAGVRSLTEHCVVGIVANEKRCRQMAENSIGIVTALCPFVGYARASSIAKEALRSGVPVRTLVLREGLLSEEQLRDALNPYAMTLSPTVSGHATPSVLVNKCIL